jgi:hypothetical protein
MPDGGSRQAHEIWHVHDVVNKGTNVNNGPGQLARDGHDIWFVAVRKRLYVF